MQIKHKRIETNSQNKIKDTPHFLNFIIWYCMGGGLLVAVSMISIFYRLLSDQYPFGTPWAFGFSIYSLIIGSVLLISGIAFLKRLKWAQLLFLLYIPIGVILSAIMKLHDQYSLIEISIVYFIFILPTGIWYFSKKTLKIFLIKSHCCLTIHW